MNGAVRRENGARALDADVEEDVARAGEDEIGREPEDPEDDRSAVAAGAVAVVKATAVISTDAHPVTRDEFLREVVDPEREVNSTSPTMKSAR